MPSTHMGFQKLPTSSSTSSAPRVVPLGFSVENMFIERLTSYYKAVLHMIYIHLPLNV